MAAQARYQSALLALASLHISFGHTEVSARGSPGPAPAAVKPADHWGPGACPAQEAMSALNETLRMAQQNNDQWCLLHALAMLCRLLGSCAPGQPPPLCAAVLCVLVVQARCALLYQ